MTKDELKIQRAKDLRNKNILKQYDLLLRITGSTKIANKYKKSSITRVANNLDIDLTNKADVKQLISNRKKIIRNQKSREQYDLLLRITGSTKISRQYREATAQTIFNDLNINVYDKINRPRSNKKPITASYKNRLEKSAIKKLAYAIKRGIAPDQAQILKYQTYKTIDLQLKYNMFFDLKYKRISAREKATRKDSWAELSSADEYPPIMVKMARDINLANNLDINAHYGFGIMYFNFLTNQDPVELQKEHKVNPENERIYYQTVTKL